MEARNSEFGTQNSIADEDKRRHNVIDLAIVGMSCKFPKADNYQEYWQNLIHGESCIDVIPRSRWDWEDYYGNPLEEDNKSNSKWGGYMNNVDLFDNDFFGLSAREVILMDPQQRIMLELSWACFEDAGIDPTKLSGKRVGVFVGAFNHDYKELQEKGGGSIEAHHATGVAGPVIPNRISYYYNFKGPSLAIDTACSSSLNAIHVAAQSIYNGESEIALAGAINLILTPTRYISFAKTGMLSPTGSCKTFDDSADGFVRAEGAGLILLKPLEQALKDKDNILGVLKGTAVNHSGKTYTITYPSPEAQAEVIKEAMIKSEVKASQINYIEAHGTGTPKGDPIEFKGLLKAFKDMAELNDEKLKDNFCGIGSAKTSVGHLEPASGMASVIKVLLSLKHKKLPGLVHYQKLNHRISLDDCPFYMVDKLTDWTHLKSGNNKKNPLRAGISAFGFGGTNAHIVLEEAPKNKKSRQQSKVPQLILLSAKTSEALSHRQRDLLAWLEENEDGISLPALSQSLLLGRAHFDKRVAFIAEDRRHLLQMLRDSLNGTDVEGGFRNINDESIEKTQLYDRLVEDATALLSKRKKHAPEIYRKQYSTLAELYVKGYEIDWTTIIGEKRYQSVRLPVYQFQKERFWIADFDSNGALHSGPSAKKNSNKISIQNVSDFDGIKFEVELHSSAFFLKDHIVHGNSILPGVVYLELVWQVISQLFKKEKGASRITNVAWVKPIIVQNYKTIHIQLKADARGFLCVVTSGEESDRLVHFQCHIDESLNKTEYPSPKQRLEIVKSDPSLSSVKLYNIFKNLGLNYGPAHTVIDQLYINNKQGIAKLKISEDLKHSFNDYNLHPSLLDGALQVSLAFSLGFTGEISEYQFSNENLKLPFALKELLVFGPCSPTMWVRVTSHANEIDSERHEITTVQLYDEELNLKVSMKGFSSRTLDSVSSSKKFDLSDVNHRGSKSLTVNEVDATMLQYVPSWKTFDLFKYGQVASHEKTNVLVIGDRGQVINQLSSIFSRVNLIEMTDLNDHKKLKDILDNSAQIEQVILVFPFVDISDKTVEEFNKRAISIVLNLLVLTQLMTRLKLSAKHISWTLITERSVVLNNDAVFSPLYSGLRGFFGSVMKEFPQWEMRMVDVEKLESLPIKEIFLVPLEVNTQFAYRENKWFIEQLSLVDLPLSNKENYRDNGIYVVIGGAGGIGEVWTEHMIRQYDARVIWLGRRENNLDIQKKLDRLNNKHSKVTYKSVDCTNRHDLQKAIEDIEVEIGHINGVIHSAIVLSDGSVAQMNEAAFVAAYNAKVGIAINMGSVFKDRSLDFMMFFSSMISQTTYAGQCNYSAGCQFVDKYAHYLNNRLFYNIKTINWGYWGSVGVVSSQEYRNRMELAGLGSIEPIEAMSLIEQVLSSEQAQVGLVKITKKNGINDLDFDSSSVITIGRLEQLSSFDDLVTKTKLIDSHQCLLAQQGGGLLMNDMDLLLGNLIWHALLEWANRSTSQSFINTDLSAYNLNNVHLKWLESTISILEQLNIVHEDDGSYNSGIHGNLNRINVEKEWSNYKLRSNINKGCRSQNVLIDTALSNLPLILNGTKSATEILFPNASIGLVEGIYSQNAAADLYNDILANAIALFVEKRITEHNHSKIRILEIGAGTGGSSFKILKKLLPYNEHIEEYCYTDVSNAFLVYAENEYSYLSDKLVFQTLNIEQSFDSQNVNIGSYDIVVATNVLHATRNIHHTLSNSNLLLKPNGILLLNELCGFSLFTHMTFGLLEGWWLYDDPECREAHAPGLSTSMWISVLKKSGFDQVKLPEKASHKYGQQIIIAENANVLPKSQKYFSANVVSNYKNTNQKSIEYNTIVEPVASYKTPSLKTDIGEHVRNVIRESVAESLRSDVSKIKNNRSFSEFGVDSIISVSLVNILNKKFELALHTTILFDYNTIDLLTKHIVEEYSENISFEEQESIAEEIKNLSDEPTEELSAAKFKNRASDNLVVKPTLGENRLDPIKPTYAHSYQRILLNHPGSVEDIAFKIGDDSFNLKEDEVRIAIKAFSLNFADLLCVKGLYPTMPKYPFTPGFEAAGYVLETGRMVTDFHVGDEVVALAGESLGCHGNMMTTHSNRVMKKPTGVSFEEITAIQLVALTMIAAFDKAGVKKGDHILIQTAAGGTGLLAVQLALHVGAIPFGTAGSQHKLDYLEKLGVQQPINYLQNDFELEIQRITNGRGVDVVINTLAGDAIQKGLNCLTDGGRYVEIAMTALKSAREIDLSMLSNNQSFHSLDIRKLEVQDPQKFREYKDEMFRLIELGVIKASIHSVFDFKDIKEAYACLENRSNIGKVVVNIAQHDQYELKDLNTNRTLFPTASKPVLNGSRDVAIIGMSGRFPGANSVNELWEALERGESLITKAERWDLTSNGLTPEENWCIDGGFLDDIDMFDPLFFNISGLEASYMDPQQRVFLEESWKALEDAGYAGLGIEKLDCGVYVGYTGGDYAQCYHEGQPAQSFWGNRGSVVPARIAYHLDLYGPAMAIDTACSSSLTAIHLACQSLWIGETTMALAGGVFIQCSSDFYLQTNTAGMLSPNGQCFTFDERANGFVPGEAVGIVVLKRLDDAIKDRDHIYGVIKGIGVNQDGLSNGITAPSGLSQERLQTKVYEEFAINPDSISMVEAHGTGTKLGDPIEYRALSQSFKKYTSKKNYCAIGSIKTNLGHTSAAAGVTGLIKVLLSMQNNKIPASLNYKKGNSNIDFDNSPFYVNTQLKEWKSATPRRAALSSFGLSGTNAHAVIEEAPNTIYNPEKKLGYLIVLSARKPDELQRSINQLRDHVMHTDDVHLGDLSYTLAQGRRQFVERFSCVVKSLSDLVDKLGNEGSMEKGDTSNFKVELDAEVLLPLCYKIGESEKCIERLEMISQLYRSGISLRFEQLFLNTNFRRIPLPTYPFTRKRYWLPEIKKTAPNFTYPHKANSLLSREEKILQKEWVIENYAQTKVVLQHVAILCSKDTLDISNKLRNYFNRVDLFITDDIELNKTVPIPNDSYELIIDLSGCSNYFHYNYGWLVLLQNIIKAGMRSAMKLISVSKGLIGFKSETINLSGATHAGLYRTLGAEYQHITSRHVDFSYDITLDELEGQLIKEINVLTDSVEVCYRDNERYVSRLKEIELIGGEEIEFNQQDVLLVTGGTRGLGLLNAKHFAINYGIKKIALLGFDSLPPYEMWEEHMTKDSPQSGKMRNIDKLIQLGIDVKVYSADLKDHNSVKSIILDVKETLGSISGVIHCAGKISDGRNPAFINKNLSEISEVLDPKVAGLQNLIDCLENENIKMFLLFSSVASGIPSLGVGQSDYALANAYMDYMAEGYHERMSMISLQWPSWSETGIGEVDSESYDSKGLLKLSNEEGLQLLDKVLFYRHALGPVVLPTLVNSNLWKTETLLKSEQKKKELPRLSSIQTTNKVEDTDGGQLNQLILYLEKVVSKELQIEIEDIDENTALQNYGVDSILISQLHKTIEYLIEVKFDPSTLYEFPTISSLSSWLYSNYKNEVKRLIGSDASSSSSNGQNVNAILVNVAKPEQQRRSHSLNFEKENEEEIVIIGMSCSFPNSATLDEYWKLLSQGNSAIENISDNRWGASNNYYGAFIDKVDNFDHKKFHLTSEEVSAMDPQSLILLEESDQLFKHAGYNKSDIQREKIGVYIGARGMAISPEKSLDKIVVAAGQNYLAANISQYFDLKGPSVVIDTACSSALVSLNMAIQEIRNNGIESAVVGGVSYHATDRTYDLFEKRGLLAQSAEFHVFDQRSSGVILGEGAGLVLVKTKSAALKDGNTIYGIVKSIAVNNDGRTAGASTPNISAQKEVMNSALLKSGLSPSDISYLEANGSGTEVTDLLELKAIDSVYGRRKEPLILGSVKPNIGHPLCAEGMASLIKVLLMFQRKEIVPFLSGQMKMEHFDIDESSLSFRRELLDWNCTKRIAAINCFADGGTNVHLILEAFYSQNHISKINKIVSNGEKENSTQQYETPKEQRSEVLVAVENIWESFN